MKDERISIMHVLYSLDTGGLENGVVNLINRMDPTLFLHAVCCISRAGRQAALLQRDDVTIFEMMRKDGMNLSMPLKLARFFRKQRTDIIHTRNWGAIDGIIGARLAGTPVVIHGEHGRDMTDPDGTNRKRNMARRFLSHWSDSIVGVSRDLSIWLTDVVGVEKKKVRTIFNGVDTVRFNPEGKEAIRAKNHLSQDDFMLGTVGRLDPVKDQHLLVEAVSRIDGNIRLVIIGDGPCREDLKGLVERHGLGDRVSLLGMRKDVPELLKMLDVFVLPSFNEGMSNTVLEAMATGVPVIATDIGGNPEMVDDGVTGFLVPRRDIASLEKVIRRYVSSRHLTRMHGEEGRKRALREFSLDKMVAGYEALYTEQIMQSRRYKKRRIPSIATFGADSRTNRS